MMRRNLFWITLIGITLGTIPSWADAVIISCTATGQNREVLLRWQTASENNLRRYEILRNGIAAGLVRADNTMNGQSYSWRDQEVQNDLDYSYTLVAVSNDGAREMLGTVSGRPAFDNYAIREYSLHQNYPNPFNPTTTIEIDLAETGRALVRVFDIVGREVARPMDQDMPQGRHSVLFDGRFLPSGIYLYQLDANSYSAQKKMILMK